MRAGVILAAAFLLSSCATPPELRQVNWIRLATPEAVIKECGREVRACSRMTMPCTIVTLREDYYAAGHELRHCYDGLFHN